MVTEMTSLAGTMGGIYARHAGEPEAVAAAIEEHVRPAYAGDRLPGTDEGAVVGLADRIDSLTGLMAAGHAASSTSDPFGLRRAALGILQISVGRGIEIDLADAVERAAALQPVAAGAEVRAAVVEFLWRRFEIWRRELGEPADVVRAAVRGGEPSPPAKVRAIEALQRLAADPEFAALHETWMRSARLTRRQPVEGPVDPALLAEPAEQALHEGARTAAEAIAADPTVAGVVAALTPLAPLITAFFEQVFVMVEDQDLARNRLALVRDVAALPAPVADLAELGESLATPAAV
jgi:glycyl-tRNA synthetase